MKESGLYSYSNKVGDATGLLSAATSHSGDKGTVHFIGTLNDGNEVEQFYTNNTARWESPTVWTDAGNLFGELWLRIIHAVDWHATAELDYGDHQYTASTGEYSSSGIQHLYSYCKGGYGGDWDDW